MDKSKTSTPHFARAWMIFEQALPWFVLTVLLSQTYAFFFRAPYPGFEFARNVVVEVSASPSTGDTLSVGDVLLQVGDVLWEDFQNNLRQTSFEGVQPGQAVRIRIQRDAGELTIDWPYPGLSRRGVIENLISGWWLAYVFWLAGTVTVLLIRPIDTRRRLLIGFYYLTAIWLAAGSGPSHWHVWEGAIQLRVAIWLCVPVYWHLHWVFPKPLGILPKAIIWGVYLACAGLAVAQWFELLPRSLYIPAFLLAVGGSLILQVAHAVLRPAHRSDIRIVGILTAVAFIPSLAMGIIYAANPSPPVASTGAILALPLLPIAYFYASFRQQAGGLELRVNRAISLYLFLVLFGTGSLILVSVVRPWINLTGSAMIAGALLVAFSAALAILSFPSFQKYVEKHLLGIPLPPSHVLESYADRITTSLDNQNLIRLLKDEVLPSLLVRQSALLRFEEDHKIGLLYSTGIKDDQLPDGVFPSDLLAHAGKFQPPSPVAEGQPPLTWIRLMLHLKIGGELVGIWLLGRRDPDDLYSQAEISILQSIANQTAIALVNIAQANRLHALYQANIERQDSERTNLARDMHDEILNQLAVLTMNVDASNFPAGFQEDYQTVIGRIRQIISGLRPAMLSYGLRSALEEFVDELSDRAGSDVVVRMDLPPSEVRYAPKVEEHLFRIVQQAGENAIRHAHARMICIGGELEQDRVNLIVEDDGIGFAGQEPLDFDHFVANRHFGLVGMYERAALIGADLQIKSAPGQGTRVSIDWKAG